MSNAAAIRCKFRSAGARTTDANANEQTRLRPRQFVLPTTLSLEKQRSAHLPTYSVSALLCRECTRCVNLSVTLPSEGYQPLEAPSYVAITNEDGVFVPPIARFGSNVLQHAFGELATPKRGWGSCTRKMPSPSFWCSPESDRQTLRTPAIRFDEQCLVVTTEVVMALCDCWV